jgi:hypothetical protein
VHTRFHHRHRGAAGHRFLEIALVVRGECGDLGRERVQARAGLDGEALEPLAHVGEEAGLRLLAVAGDVDAAVDLLLDAGMHRVAHGRLPGLAGRALAHQVEQRMRPRQAADMGGEDAVGAVLDAHRRFLGRGTTPPP